MKIIRNTSFGVFKTPLRNIQMKFDGYAATFDLVPGLVVSNNNFDPNLKNSALQNMFKNANEIIESSDYLKVEFDTVLGLALDADIDVDLYGGLHQGWEAAPKFKNSNAIYPFLEIVDSPWKKQLPDHRGRDNPEIKHYRLISSGGGFDILAWEPTGKWVIASPSK